jgi:hypothetical protein
MAKAARKRYPDKAAEEVLPEDLTMRFLRWLGIGLFLIVTVCHSVSARAQTHDGSELTTICQFTSGPRAGTTFDFKPYGVKPLPVGHPCTDFQGSTGIAGIGAAATPDLSATSAPSPDSNLTTVCQFNSGPKAGTSFDFKPYGVQPIAVGRPCSDFQGSTGVAGFAAATASSPNVSASPAPGQAPKLTTVCQFNSGPKAGTSFDFQPYGTQPLPVGHPCTDFQGSNGIAGIATASAPGRDPSATPAASQKADLSTVCQFNSGPRAGTTFDFQPYGTQPLPVGHPCTDFQGSTGIAGPSRNLPKQAGLRPVLRSYQ